MQKADPPTTSVIDRSAFLMKALLINAANFHCILAKYHSLLSVSQQYLFHYRWLNCYILLPNMVGSIRYRIGQFPLRQKRGQKSPAAMAFIHHSQVALDFGAALWLLAESQHTGHSLLMDGFHRPFLVLL